MSSLLKFFLIIVDLKRIEGEDFKRLEGEGVPGALDVRVPHVPVTQKYRFHKMKVKWKKISKEGSVVENVQERPVAQFEELPK